MYGVKEYIAQQGKNFLYSEMLYQQSAVVGGTNRALIDWNERGAVFMLIHSINLSVPTIGAVAATINDQFTKPILFFNMDLEFSGQYILEYMIPTSKLLLTCSRAEPKFTVGYQFLTIKDKK